MREVHVEQLNPTRLKERLKLFGEGETLPLREADLALLLESGPLHQDAGRAFGRVCLELGRTGQQRGGSTAREVGVEADSGSDA